MAKIIVLSVAYFDHQTVCSLAGRRSAGGNFSGGAWWKRRRLVAPAGSVQTWLASCLTKMVTHLIAWDALHLMKSRKSLVANKRPSDLLGRRRCSSPSQKATRLSILPRLRLRTSPLSIKTQRQAKCEQSSHCKSCLS